MQRVNPDHPFIVQMQRGPSFGIEEYSEGTLQQATKLAIGQHLDNPDWVQIMDREDNIIITREQTAQKFNDYCKENKIRTFSIEVSLA